jgi:hypothetical protein
MLIPNRLKELFTRSANGDYPSVLDHLPEDISGNGFTHGDLNLWPDPGDRSYSLDTAVCGVGTVVNVLPQFFWSIKKRGLASTSINQVSGASATWADGESLRAIMRENVPFRFSEGKGYKPSRHWVHPHSPLVNYRTLAQGQVTGMASDPLRGVQFLYNNTSLRTDVDALVQDVTTTYHRHRMVGGKFCWVSAFGGHDPLAKYARAKTLQKVNATFLVDVEIIPASAGELLSNSYARGEVYRQVAAGVEPNRLVILVQNGHRGVHETDQPLADALVSILASATQGSELDGDSLTNTMRKCSCGFVECVPTFLDVPMAVGVEHFRHRPDNWYNWRLDQEHGDRTLDILLQRVHQLLARAPSALHIVVITGYFPTSAEVHQLKAMVQDKVRTIPGEVIAVVNQQTNPPSQDSMLRYGVTDFVGAQELPPPVFSPFLSALSTFTRSDTVLPGEFLERFRPSDEELDKAHQVQDMVDRLL